MNRLLAAFAAVVTAVGLVLTVTSAATAAPTTKYYTVTAPSVVPSGTTAITITLGNCGTTSTDCPKVSQQYFGSALITIPSSLPSVSVSFSGPASKIGAWQSRPVSGGVLLTNTGASSTDAIAPGESLGVTLNFATAPASGAYTFTTDVKQSNDFSGTGNDFLTKAGNTSPAIIGSVTVYVGYPDHLAFITQPSSVERYASGTLASYNQMCPPPSVGVYDSSNNLITALDGLSVTLAPATGSDDPGLNLVNSSTVSATTSHGVATFGTSSNGSCSNGVYATVLGFDYRLSAAATWQPNSSTSVSLSTTTASVAFDVLQYRRPCGTTCSTTFSGTHVNWNVNASGPTSSTLSASFGSGFDGALSCASQLQDGTTREGLAIDLANHTKTVTLTFDKFIFNNTSNNGTPFWAICFGAPYQFPTVTGYTAVPSGDPLTGDYEGLLVDCGTADPTQWPAGTYPCVVSRKKNAANEIIVVSIPQNGASDPRMI